MRTWSCTSAGRPQANYRSQPELTALISGPGIRVLGYLEPTRS